MDIPTFFSDRKEILTYDYSKVLNLLGTKNDHSYAISNLSIDDENMVSDYFKSIMLGYNHVYIKSLLDKMGKPSANISLPLIHQWRGVPQIDNLVIVSHPDDAERICKKHIKKAPIFKSLLNTSIISTTDNEDWRNQRNNMTNAFLPKYSLQTVFPASIKRARLCSELLIKMSCDYSEAVNMSDFFFK